MERGPDRQLSLWLCPEGEVHDRLAAVIATLGRRHGTPTFEPHLTLLGGAGGPEGETCRRAAEVARRLRPFTVHLARLGHRDEYYRCLFVEAERTTELHEARRVAEEAFAREPDPDYLPHVSLMYGDPSRERKERLVEEIGRTLPRQFRADAVFLFSTEGEPATWMRVARLPLG